MNKYVFSVNSSSNRHCWRNCDKWRTASEETVHWDCWKSCGVCRNRSKEYITWSVLNSVQDWVSGCGFCIVQEMNLWIYEFHYHRMKCVKHLTCSVFPVTEIHLLQSCCKKKIGGLFAWSCGHACKSDLFKCMRTFFCFCFSLKITSCSIKLGADTLSSDLTLSTRSEWEHCTLIFLLQPHASDCEIIFSNVSFPFMVSR